MRQSLSCSGSADTDFDLRTCCLVILFGEICDVLGLNCLYFQTYRVKIYKVTYWGTFWKNENICNDFFFFFPPGINTLYLLLQHSVFIPLEWVIIIIAIRLSLHLFISVLIVYVCVCVLGAVYMCFLVFLTLLFMQRVPNPVCFCHMVVLCASAFTLCICSFYVCPIICII